MQNSFEKKLLQTNEQLNFGKTMENIRKRVYLNLVTSKEKL